MVMSLWLPIVVSAALVFLVSSVIHMVLMIHKNDLRKLDKEAEIMAALRPFSIPPGDYFFPRAKTMKDMKTPEFAEKLKQGPIAIMTVVPSGGLNMGKSLGLWFVYCLIVGAVAAYVAVRALAPGAAYMNVFPVVSATAFAGYSLALLQDAIWHARSWRTTITTMVDGLVYALVTGGTFGWLWPS